MRMQDFRIRAVEISFESFSYRTPMKFRATVVDRVTLLNVEIVGTLNGKTTVGYGSMPLGNVWSFPSSRLTFDETLAAMKGLASRLQSIVDSSAVAGHPIQINHELEPLYLAAAAEFELADPIPSLCTLVVASSFDAAIHDAYAKALGLNAYLTYSREYMDHDLGYYLDQQFRDEYLDRYVTAQPTSSLSLYHLVGALDPLTGAEVKTKLDDGMPETLEEWVQAEHLDHIKIKLDGNAIDWDVDRILSVDSVLSGLNPNHALYYSLDFNERCESVDYVIECLAKVREAAATALARVQYIEQPTHRDLNRPGTPSMHEAAQIKPVVIDESLIDYESLLRARELGYSGVALKACKGQSNALLMAAAAQKFGLFLCVQDLTCPGASLVQSAALAAHIPPVRAIEANARQYVPSGNRAWESRFPGLFCISDGRMHTGNLDGVGLGVVPVLSHTYQEN